MDDRRADRAVGDDGVAYEVDRRDQVDTCITGLLERDLVPILDLLGPWLFWALYYGFRYSSIRYLSGRHLVPSEGVNVISPELSEL